MDDEGDENMQKIKCLDFYEAVVPIEIRIQNEFDFIHKAGDRRIDLLVSFYSPVPRTNIAARINRKIITEIKVIQSMEIQLSNISKQARLKMIST